MVKLDALTKISKVERTGTSSKKFKCRVDTVLLESIEAETFSFILFDLRACLFELVILA